MLGQIIPYALCAVIVLGALWLIRGNFWLYLEKRNGSWHSHDGRMRRRINDRWEYRDMTPEEVKEERSSDAW